MTLGNKISELRKAKGMTQEALANQLGVSNQAVSKWEANQSCPDIQLLPTIADLFEISLDALFGREEKTSSKQDNVLNLPWEDDGKLRAVIYVGHSLIGKEECEKAAKITFEYEGPALDVISSFSVTCDEVQGNVSAGGDVTCDDISGSVNAGGDVSISKAIVHMKNKLKNDIASEMKEVVK
ncbi:MAG: helix-turn-helix transcriptional regulator [Agathobacter sp.]|nr:helix-turn-helix transcriptional regulator [Agathobacter sp.]